MQTNGLIASPMSRFINARIGLLVLGLSTTLGCAPHSLPALSPFAVGSPTCPHCRLLPGQGCACHPDVWTHGYHATLWRPMYWEYEDDHPAPEDIPTGDIVEPDLIVPDAEQPPRVVPDDDPPPSLMDLFDAPDS